MRHISIVQEVNINLKGNSGEEITFYFMTNYERAPEFMNFKKNRRSKACLEKKLCLI